MLLADTADRFDIGEFRVDGNTVLPARDIERTVYDFLGPNRDARSRGKGARGAGITLPKARLPGP